MSKKITFTDDAKADIQEAYDYYENLEKNRRVEFKIIVEE